MQTSLLYQDTKALRKTANLYAFSRFRFLHRFDCSVCEPACEAFSSDRDLPAVVSSPFSKCIYWLILSTTHELPTYFLLPFEAQLPLKMLANSHCLVTDNLCQDEICSNQSPSPPQPLPPHPTPFATCQTRLYLTRQGNDGICHLCKLLHNLI